MFYICPAFYISQQDFSASLKEYGTPLGPLTEESGAHLAPCPAKVSHHSGEN